MKRFIFLIAFLVLGIGGITLAAMPKEKKAVKIEVSSIVNQVTDLTITTVLDLNFIAAPSGEVINKFRPPTVIEKINSIYKTSISSKSITSARNFLPDIRRLSWASVVAASNRHI